MQPRVRVMFTDRGVSGGRECFGFRFRYYHTDRGRERNKLTPKKSEMALQGVFTAAVLELSETI